MLKNRVEVNKKAKPAGCNSRGKSVSGLQRFALLKKLVMRRARRRAGRMIRFYQSARDGDFLVVEKIHDSRFRHLYHVNSGEHRCKNYFCQ